MCPSFQRDSSINNMNKISRRVWLACSCTAHSGSSEYVAVAACADGPCKSRARLSFLRRICRPCPPFSRTNLIAARTSAACWTFNLTCCCFLLSHAHTSTHRASQLRSSGTQSISNLLQRRYASNYQWCVPLVQPWQPSGEQSGQQAQERAKRYIAPSRLPADTELSPVLPSSRIQLPSLCSRLIESLLLRPLTHCPAVLHCACRAVVLCLPAPTARPTEQEG